VRASGRSKIDGCRARLGARIVCMASLVQSAAATSLERRRNALRRANEIRSARARLKQELRDGDASITALLAEPPEQLSTAKVVDLLMAVPKIGPVRATRLLRMSRISETRTVGGLSPRQRSRLLELLGP
jgi:hypothetical protein